MSSPSATISFFGIAIGAVALLMALVHIWAGPFSPQPSIEEVVAEKAVAIREAAQAALRGEETPKSSSQSSFDTDRIVQVLTAILGGLAIIFGVVGRAKDEPMRVAGGAIALGGGALAFQFLAVALGIIVIAILVSAVLGGGLG